MKTKVLEITKKMKNIAQLMTDDECMTEHDQRAMHALIHQLLNTIPIPLSETPLLLNDSTQLLGTSKVSTRRKLVETGICSIYDIPNVCSICNTTNTSQWRRGPTGPKTLCNACGIHYARKKKIKIK